MIITFIHHSSFLVETPLLTMLFDYFKGNLPPLNREKPLYILTSHSHSDHYGRVIYDLGKNHPDARYILSSDIPKRDVPPSFGSPVRFIGPHEEYHDGLLTLTTLKSNDKGVAFVCEAGGIRVYHGGDLNNWYWDRGETALEDERIYHEELKRIEGTEFDAAFIPLDPRLQNYHIGIDNFMEHAEARAIFPMHFWGQFQLIDEFVNLPTTAGYREHVMAIREEGQIFRL